MKKNLLLIIALVFSAVNTFATNGIYLEFNVTSQSANGVYKTYSSGGDTRSEMNMSISMGANSRSISSVTLILHSTPGTVYTLNETNKTYSEMNVNKSAGENNDDYDITVIGKEKVNSYNSTHVKVLNKRTQQTSEMWLSKDVLDYSYFTTVKNKYLGGSKFFSALKAQGADGFVVRMLVSAERGGQMQMDLVTAEKRDLDPSLFSLGGYTKGGSSMAPAGAPTAPAVDVNAIQKMTPEERQKYIQDMKAKYQQPQH